MDLSHSGMFEKVKDAFHAQTRGGYRQWFNPVYADPNKNTRLRPTKTNAMLFAEDKDEDEEELMPREDDEEVENEPTNGIGKNNEGLPRGENEQYNENNFMDPQLMNMAQYSGSQAPSRAASRAPSVMPQLTEDQPARQAKPARIRNVGEIQVLDFHSDNPIISYKGRIFSGTWASNIGTELIFGSHDEIAQRGLPYLRTLPGEVDLMAASSVRIVTTPADLRPKNPGFGMMSNSVVNPLRRQTLDRYKWLRKDIGIEIPVAFDKHGRRKPQARFLENLMAIKRTKGETDEVTTVTRDTTRDFVDRDDDPEEASLQKKRARDRRRQKRLTEERASKPKEKRRGGNRWLKRRVVSFAERGQSDSGDGDGDGDGEGDESMLSTKTPNTWGDLGAGHGQGNIGEDTAMNLD